MFSVQGSRPLVSSLSNLLILGIVLRCCEIGSGFQGLVVGTWFRPSLQQSSWSGGVRASILRTTAEKDESGSDELPSVVIHHAALKTRNITTAIQFYSLLGFGVSCKFRAGPARAAWLTLSSSQSRLELIEVPAYMLDEAPGTRRRAVDLMEYQAALGYNHVAVDVTSQVQHQKLSSLEAWMDQLNERSVAHFGKTLRVALQPRQQLIGRSVYELAFLYDADGCLVELLNKQSELLQDVESGWDPWDGQGFVGTS